MDYTNGELDAVVQATIEGDADFQASIEGLTDEEKSAKISEKSEEVKKDAWKKLVEEHKKASEIAKDQKGRAERVENELKKLKTTPPAEQKETKTDDLTVMDGILLTQAGITTVEDIKTARDYAKLNGVSLQDAIANPIVKGIIEERKEKQASALASATNSPRRGPSKPSNEAVLEKFRTKGADSLTKEESAQLFYALRGKQK